MPRFEGVKKGPRFAGQKKTRKPVKYGRILPVRHDDDGVMRFDPSAGLLGAATRALTLPGEVYRGEVDPMSDEGRDRAMEMAAFTTPASVATRSGVGFLGAPITKKARVKPPTAMALKEASEEGFEAMRQTGAEYSSAAVSQMARNIQTKLEEQGILQELAPKSYTILQKLQNPPENSIATIQGLVAARRALRNARKDFNNPTDQKAARDILSGLDDFIGGAGTGSSMAQSAAQAKAGRLLKEANANYAAYKRSGRLHGLGESSELRAKAVNSGKNIGNTIRSRASQVVDPLYPKRAAGYNPDEIAAIRAVAEGSRAANITRDIGNTLGGGGGLGSLVTGGAGLVPGYMFGSPELSVAGAFALPIAGRMSKGLSNRLTKRALNQADDMVRSRSPLHEAMKVNAPLQRGTPELREALIRALVLQRAQMGAVPLSSNDLVY